MTSSKEVENLRRMFGADIWAEPTVDEHPAPRSFPAMTDSNVRRGTRNLKVDSPESDSDGWEIKTTNEVVDKVQNPKMTTGVSRRHARERAEQEKTAPRVVDQAAFRDLGLEQGQQAPHLEVFCPWKLLVRYVELYVGKTNTPLVEPYFDKENLFKNQSWDFFYLYNPDNLNDDPLLLVPTSQLNAMLAMINKDLHISLSIPPGEPSAKFFQRFEDGIRPRYLGRTRDSASYDSLLNAVPLPDPADDFSDMTEWGKGNFLETLKNIRQSFVGDKKKGKSKKAARLRHEKHTNWGRATKRVQRYLGLRQKAANFLNYREVTGQEEASSPRMTELDVKAPASFHPEDDVVFICFDVETAERSPMIVTEIGFGILDTRDLVGVAPGLGGEHWLPLIRGRHLRIKEYTYMVNHEFVQGCPENFITSDVVGIDKVTQTIEDIMTPKDKDGKMRKVIIVGHDVKQDIELLKPLDFNVYDMPNLKEVVDNQQLHQHRSQINNGAGLSAVLNSLNISYNYLHNAGNDAVYTLQSLIRLAIIKRHESLAKSKLKGQAQRVHRPRAHDPLDPGWDTGGEDTDGGYPGQPIDPKPIVPRYDESEWATPADELEFPTRPVPEDFAPAAPPSTPEPEKQEKPVDDDWPGLLGGW